MSFIYLGIALAKKVDAIKNITIPPFRRMVKFGEKYAIRKGYWFTGYLYKDLTGNHHLSRNSEYFSGCLGTKEQVEKYFTKGVAEVV